MCLLLTLKKRKRKKRGLFVASVVDAVVALKICSQLCNLFVSVAGTALLAMTSTEVDKSGASYYGEQGLNYLDVNGTSNIVTLCKCCQLQCEQACYATKTDKEILCVCVRPHNYTSNTCGLLRTFLSFFTWPSPS